MPTIKPKHDRSGRPQIWPTQIEAPLRVRELYALIASFHDSDAFDTCHIWSGAMNGNQPVIKWQKKNKGVVQVLSGYLGLPTSRNTCGNKKCVNPFHHLPYAAPEAQIAEHTTRPETPKIPNANLDDYIELVQDVIDKQAVRKEDLNFETLRTLIHPDDITDENLRDSLKQMGL